MQSDSLQLIEVYTTSSDLKKASAQLGSSHCISALDDLLKTPFSESYFLLVVGPETSPLRLHQWLLKNQYHFQKRLKIIYIYDFLTIDEIVLLSANHGIFKIFHREELPKEWPQAWIEVNQSFAGLVETKDIMGRVRAQNKVLNELNDNLEKIVEQRTGHLEVSRKEIEQKNKETRDLIKFIKSLSNVEGFEDLVLILKHEFIRYHKVESPLMIYSLGGYTYRCISFQGPQILDRAMKLEPNQKNFKDQQRLREILADTLARPIGPVLSVSLEGPEHHGMLIFEHNMDALEQKNFLQILERRIESLRVAFDRLALKWKAHQISRQWSMTFDALLDPIVIIDANYKVIRANKSFADSPQSLCHKSFADREQACVGCPVSFAFSQQKAHTSKVSRGDRMFEVHSYPILIEPSEKKFHMIVHYTDITQSTKLQGQIIQSEKMAALGLLAGNIAHELNNPLTGIRSLAQILMKEIGSQHVVYSDLKEIEQAAQRSELIIKNLLDFSSLHESRKEEVSLHSIVEKTLPFLKTTMRYHQSHIDLAKEDDFVDVEPQLLQQVIFNLVNNACQAMGDEGVLTLSSYVDSKHVFFSVKDTGPGIPQEIREAIFAPFFTTKEEGQGTGLGLSMSRSIVEKFGGQLYLNESCTEGSEFIIRLPKVVFS
jgi:two-component system, NtrC family, sensor kinase